LAGFLFFRFSIGWTVLIPGPKKRKQMIGFGLDFYYKKRKLNFKFNQKEKKKKKIMPGFQDLRFSRSYISF
jgi:hypothetical protein